jgi:cyclic pyranopterin phosphate synthase
MLSDQFGRKVNYLRISVTDRCNLRCRYCIPQEGVPLKKHEDLLSFEEIEIIARAAVELGIDKIRLTGGEPLLRKGFVELVKKLAPIEGLKDLALTTNGLLLGPMAAELREAGIKRVNISLDTLKPERFKQMTGSDDWQQAKEGFEKALETGFEQVKLNVVLIDGYNDDEVEDFVEYILDKNTQLRFIEFMPVGNQHWSSEKVLLSSNIIKRIDLRHHIVSLPPLKNSTVEEYQIVGSPATVGFISPISNSFCRKCNRLRLTADGFLKPCLASKYEVNIKVPVRDGHRGNELRRVFYEAMRLKPKAHKMDQGLSDNTRHMAEVGG